MNGTVNVIRLTSPLNDLACGFCCKCASQWNEGNDQRIAHTISITKGRERVLLILSTTAITSAVPSQLTPCCSILADGCSILAEQLFHSSWYDPVAQLYRPSYQSLDHRSLTIVNRMKGKYTTNAPRRRAGGIDCKTGGSSFDRSTTSASGLINGGGSDLIKPSRLTIELGLRRPLHSQRRVTTLL